MKAFPIACLFVVLAAGTALGDESPRIVLWTFGIQGRALHVPVELKTDDGYMVLNDGTQENPKPHYILGDKKRGMVTHFESKKEFLAPLAQLPKGGVIAWHDRCTVPGRWGLREEDQLGEEFDARCTRLGLVPSERIYRRCICPDVSDDKR